MLSRTTGWCSLALLLTGALAFASTPTASKAAGTLNHGTVSAAKLSNPNNLAPNATIARRVTNGGSRVDCPPGSFFSQPLTDSTGSWSFYSSDQDVGGSSYKCFDDYGPVPGSIGQVTFWGLSLTFSGGFTNCTSEPTPSFLVEFWAPGPLPGGLIHSYTVSATGVATGDTYAGFPCYAYTVTLVPPVTDLPSGWISIQGQTSSGTCSFLWGNSPTGNVNAQQEGASPPALGDNLAFCIAGEYVPTFGACCDEPSATCSENVELINCLGSDKRFIENGTCDQFDPPCGQVLGACCYDDGTCALVPQYLCRPKYPGDMNCDGSIDFADIDPFVLALSGPEAYYAQFDFCNWLDGDCNGDGLVDFADIDAFVALLFTSPAYINGTYLGPNTTCDMCPCSVLCPPGSSQEQEPCGDDTNGGCNMATPTFEPIACGETKCGTAWFDGSTRDTDWYQIDLTTASIITVEGSGEFEMVIGVLEQLCAGTPGCDNLTGSLNPYLVIPECETGSVTTGCLQPGTYYVFAATSFAQNEPCRQDYYIRVTCEPCELPLGACCFFPSGACSDGLNEQACACQGGTFQGAGSNCDDVICPVPPPGDSCADALLISDPLPAEVTNNTCAYSDSYDAVCPYVNPGAPDAVYQYTPNADRLVKISLCHDATDYDSKLYVYAGDCGTSPIACNDDFCSTASFPFSYVSEISEVQLTGGVTYYIVVDGYGPADCGNFDMTIEEVLPCVVPCPGGSTQEAEPCGDDVNGGCNMVTPYFEPITCGETLCGTGWYDGSTRDTDWFILTLTQNMRVTMTCTAEFAVLIGQISAPTSGNPCPVTAFAISATALKCVPVSITTQCLGPGNYYFFVGPQFTDVVNCPAAYVATWTCEPCELAPNDTCGTAIPIALDTPVIADNSTAADDSGGCSPAPATAYKGLWYSIVGNGTTYTATTCNAGGTFSDTVLSVYTDCAGTCVGGNDDSTCSISSLRSTFSWCAESGVTYYILVGAYSSSYVGSIELSVSSNGQTCGALPGETCANAIVVPSLPYDVTGSTVGYAHNYNAVCPYTATGASDVVYSYAPAADQTVHISLCNAPTNYDSKLYVFDNVCSGTPVACNDDFCTTASFGSPYVSDLAAVALTAGHTYYIVVDGYSSSDAGTYEMTITSP